MLTRLWLFPGMLCLSGVLFISGCATTPEAQQAQEDKTLEIEKILTQSSEYGEAERCLSPNQYRHVRILDDQHILFEGRRDQQWINTLPMRCPGLRRNSTLVIERFSTLSSLCKLDSVGVYDRFDNPWYRRWPWQWTSGPRCGLGEFQPVSKEQVQALENAIKGGNS